MTDRDTFRDGWGPGSFDADDWRAGDRDGFSDHDAAVVDKLRRETNAFRNYWRDDDRDYDQHQERQEHADEHHPNLLSWTLVRDALLWIAAFIGTSVVGFVFGVMIVRSFL